LSSSNVAVSIVGGVIASAPKYSFH